MGMAVLLGARHALERCGPLVVAVEAVPNGLPVHFILLHLVRQLKRRAASPRTSHTRQAGLSDIAKEITPNHKFTNTLVCFVVPRDSSPTRLVRDDSMRARV
eukprot:2258179-Pyramimonas_sp.AAC.1